MQVSEASAVHIEEVASLPSQVAAVQAVTVPPNDWDNALIGTDFSWVANAASRYNTVLAKLPEVLSWSDSSKDYYSNLDVFARSVAVRRFKSLLEYVAHFDAHLSSSMRSSFHRLSSSNQLRFLTAPETYYNITSVRRKPADSLISLCNALNGELAQQGACPAKEGYATALGDIYFKAQGSLRAHPVSLIATVRAPLMANEVPIDFASPNARSAQETNEKVVYGLYTTREELGVCKALNEAMNAVARTNIYVSELITTNVKVIVPLRVDAGSGSTSQPHYPGRVLLRGVERCTVASLASALIHEAMHQVLYKIEFGGAFVFPDPEVWAARATSLWTGRDLPLHSFIHACFIWYGLSQFWALPGARSIFGLEAVEQELGRATRGFRRGNPLDTLGSKSCMLRYDVAKVATSLHGKLFRDLALGGPTTY